MVWYGNVVVDLRRNVTSTINCMDNERYYIQFCYTLWIVHRLNDRYLSSEQLGTSSSTVIIILLIHEYFSSNYLTLWFALSLKFGFSAGYVVWLQNDNGFI